MIETYPFPTGRAQDARMFLEKLSELQRKEEKKRPFQSVSQLGTQNCSPPRRVNRGCDTDQVQAHSTAHVVLIRCWLASKTHPEVA